MLEKLQQQRGPVPVVVSCRVADTEQLPSRAPLQGAVVIETLARLVFEAYLDRNSERLGDLRAVLDDQQLWASSTDLYSLTC